MDRIDSRGAVAEPPTPEAPETEPGYFSPGDEETVATVLTAAWCNGVQEELINTIRAGGVIPSRVEHDQLLRALRVLIARAPSVQEALEAAGEARDGAALAQSEAAEATTRSQEALTLANQNMGRFIIQGDPVDANEFYQYPANLYLTNADPGHPNLHFPSELTTPVYIQVVTNDNGTSVTQFVWNETGGNHFQRCGRVEWPAPEEPGEPEEPGGEPEEPEEPQPAPGPEVTWTHWKPFGGGGTGEGDGGGGEIDLSHLAPLESPAFTGFPTAPTAPVSSNDHIIANTEFVQQLVGTMANSVGGNRTFTTSQSWTVPKTAAYAFTLYSGSAGGGGGGARPSAYAGSGGGGGGGGGAQSLTTTLNLNANAVVAVTIGAGGAGGSGATSSVAATAGGAGGLTKIVVNSATYQTTQPTGGGAGANGTGIKDDTPYPGAGGAGGSPGGATGTTGGAGGAGGGGAGGINGGNGGAGAAAVGATATAGAAGGNGKVSVIWS